jgi:hypothetical protein
MEEFLAKGGTGEESSDRISPPFLRGAGGDLKSWLTTHNIREQEFCDSEALLRSRNVSQRSADRLTTQSENNFMYLSQILPAIAQGFYSEPFHFDTLPSALEKYYQSHWQRIKGKGWSPVELAVLNILVYQKQPISAQAVSEAMPAGLIAQIIDEDEYEVEAVLENWIEFLLQQPIDGETRYSLYHSSFRDWLGRQLNLGQLKGEM